jgi:hypothetical protein
MGFVFLAVCLLRAGLSTKRVEEKLNAASGMTVRFEDFSIGWLGGVDLRGVTATGGGGDSFSVRSVFVRPNLWAGIRGRLRFEEVRLRDIRFVRMERAKAPDQSSQANPDGTTDSSVAEKKGAVRVRDILGLARRIEVTNAGLDWMKASGSVRAQAEGIDFRYEETALGKGVGEVTVQRGVWQELLAVDALRAKVLREDDVLTIPDFFARCGDGKLVGTGSLHLSREAPFVVSLSAAGVDLGTMSRELPTVRAAGKADANFRLEGLMGEQPTWTGAGELTVSDGMFKGLALLQMLGQVFQVQELAQLTARKAHAKIRIAQRKAYLEGLDVDAGDIQLHAPGEVDFKRSLSLNAQISLAESMIKGKALQFFGNRFSPPDAAGRRSLSFQVTGTLDHPKTDLMEKLVGENLGEIVGGALGGVLDQFLGGLLKPRKNAKTAPKADATPDAGSGGESGGAVPAKPQ